MADFGNLGFTQNPYLSQTVDSALNDTVRNYNLAVQPSFNASMVRSGSFGNAGVDQMNQEAQRQLQTSLGRQANDMRSGNYWQAMNFDNQNYWNNQNFDRGVYNDTFNQNQQQFQNGLNLLGMQNQANQQNLGFGTTIQNTPMSYYGNFNQQANSIGQGYGTTTGTMSAQGSPIMGALGGWQLGSQIGKSMGGGWAPSASAGSSNWADGSGNYAQYNNYDQQP